MSLNRLAVAIMAVVFVAVVAISAWTSIILLRPASTAVVAGTPIPMPTGTPYVPVAPHTSVSGVAAKVDGVVVPMDLFLIQTRLAAVQLQQGKDPVTGAREAAVDLRTTAGMATYGAAERTIFQSLVGNALAISYAQTHGLMPTSAQIAAQMTGYQTNAGGAAAFAAQLGKQGLTIEQLRTIVKWQLATQATETALTAHLGCPCDVRLRGIVLKTSDTGLALRLSEDLQANHGATFAALAAKYSIDTTTKKLGGDLGYLSKSEIMPVLSTVAFALKVGQVSAAVKTDKGWYIMQATAQRPAQTAVQAYFSKWTEAQRSRAHIDTYVSLPPA